MFPAWPSASSAEALTLPSANFARIASGWSVRTWRVVPHSRLESARVIKEAAAEIGSSFGIIAITADEPEEIAGFADFSFVAVGSC